MKIYFTIFFVFFYSLSFSQQEFNQWYFGLNSHLDFNSVTNINDLPLSTNNSQMSAFEGCSSISDSEGNLLLYSDGITVWNKNHEIMSNGTNLFSHSSCTQAALIIKKPGSENIYYIFTNSTSVESNGNLYYSEIDMNLENGLGAVTDLKNILLLEDVNEKLCALYHNNQNDIWIITRKSPNNYYSFLIDENEINIDPVISSEGSDISQLCPGCLLDIHGHLKASPDGTKIAATFNEPDLTSWSTFGMVELYDFDNNTGVLSNSQVLYQSNSFGSYGVEFSPNSQVLYHSTTTLDNFNGGVYQYDLSSNDINTIINSATNVYIPTNNFGIPLNDPTSVTAKAALQLGPDGKIYLSTLNGDIDVISSPNILGTFNQFGLNYYSCNYQQNAIGVVCKYGLPNYITPLILNDDISSIDYLCLGSDQGCVPFFEGFAEAPNGYSSLDECLQNCEGIEIISSWNCDLDDGCVELLNNTGSFTSLIDCEDECNLPIEYSWGCENSNCIEYSNNLGEYATFEDCNENCNENIIKAENFCFGDQTSFTTEFVADTYFWFFDDPNGAENTSQEMSANHTFSEPGIYNVTLTTSINGNINTSNISIEIIDLIIDLGPDRNICDNETITLDVSIIDGQYLWQDGSNQSFYNINTAGNYHVDIIDLNGCFASDSIEISESEAPIATISGDGIICKKSKSFALITCDGISPFEVVMNNGLLLDTISLQDQKYVEVFEEGSYNLISVIDKYGCKGSVSGTASFESSNLYASFYASSYEEYIDNSLITFVNNSSNHNTSHWSFGDGNIFSGMQPIFDYEFENYGQFIVSLIVTDEFSCTDTISREFNILTYPIFIPNSFTPGSGFMNNYFDVQIEKFNDFQIKIFDRWGQYVFSSNDINYKWDGSYKQMPLPIGTYVYKIQYKDLANSLIKINGTVNLIR